MASHKMYLISLEQLTRLHERVNHSENIRESRKRAEWKNEREIKTDYNQMRKLKNKISSYKGALTSSGRVKKSLLPRNEETNVTSVTEKVEDAVFKNIVGNINPCFQLYIYTQLYFRYKYKLEQ